MEGLESEGGVPRKQCQQLGELVSCSGHATAMATRQNRNAESATMPRPEVIAAAAARVRHVRGNVAHHALVFTNTV